MILQCFIVMDDKLCGVADLLEGRDAIQRDRGGLRKWTCVNILKFSKARCKVLYLNWCSLKRREQT